MAAICHITNLPCSICSPFICTLSQRRGLAHMHGAHILLYVGKSKREKLALQFIFIPTYIQRVTVWRGKWIWGEWKSPWCKSTDRSCTSLRQHSSGRWSDAARQVQCEPWSAFPGEEHNTKQQKSGTRPNCPPKIPQGLLWVSLCLFTVFYLYTYEAEIHPLLKDISPLR